MGQAIITRSNSLCAQVGYVWFCEILSTSGGILARSTRGAQMSVVPCGDHGPTPHSSDRQFGYGLWKVVVLLDELVYSLPGNTEHLGDLRDADQVNGH